MITQYSHFINESPEKISFRLEIEVICGVWAKPPHSYTVLCFGLFSVQSSIKFSLRVGKSFG